MTDRRFLAANTRVAHHSLRGQVDAQSYVNGQKMACSSALADLCAAPNGARDKQLLFGQEFQILEVHEGWAFGFDIRDNYVGYIAQEHLGHAQKPTHSITQRSAHIYPAADFKSRETSQLSYGSRISIIDDLDGFSQVATGGFIAHPHLSALDETVKDFAHTAELFLGTPYLWGGNSGFGIDCSGLVQIALHASGIDCPRDSDLQANAFDPVSHRNDLQRGDLVFWKGHVGLMLDRDRLIHANAHHMRVAIEPLDTAASRIAQKEFGEITGFARP